MRRTTLIFGLMLTLTACVWGSALAAIAAACCSDEMSAHAAAPAPDEHDCCRAKLGEPDAPHAEATGHAHAAAATHEADEPSPEPQAESPHAGMDCAGAGEPEDGAKAAAFGERSCLECCAGRSNRTPTTATVCAPEPNKVKRAAPNVSASAHDSFAPVAQGVSHLTPTQHAPPATRERRHILISVFLI